MSESPNTVKEVSLYTIPHGQDRDGIVKVIKSSLSDTFKNDKFINGTYGRVLLTENLEVNDIKWTKITYFVVAEQTHYLTERNGYTFWISGDDSRLNLNQILSTFKFIE